MAPQHSATVLIEPSGYLIGLSCTGTVRWSARSSKQQPRASVGSAGPLHLLFAAMGAGTGIAVPFTCSSAPDTAFSNRHVPNAPCLGTCVPLHSCCTRPSHVVPVAPAQDARKADRSPERSPHVVAAQQGDMAMLQCLQRVGYPVATKRKVFQEAVRKRCCVRALQWMVDSGFPVDWEEVEQEDVQRRPASPRVWSEQSVWIHSQFQVKGVRWDAIRGSGAYATYPYRLWHKTSTCTHTGCM